jgi:hypothetical protein
VHLFGKPALIPTGAKMVPISTRIYSSDSNPALLRIVDAKRERGRGVVPFNIRPAGLRISTTLKIFPDIFFKNTEINIIQESTGGGMNILCPNVMTVGEMLAGAYSDLKRTDSFAYGSMNTSIGYLSPDPPWLTTFRARMSMLRDACAGWQQSKPDIWAQILLPFANYYTLFAGFTKTAREYGDNRELWLIMLEQLKKELISGKKDSQNAENQFKSHINELKRLEKLLSTSSNEAWTALAGTEQAMVELAGEMVHVQDEINQLQHEISASEISGGKTYVQSVVKTIYTIASSTSVEIPYLTIISLVLTTGSLAYDLILTNQSISRSLDRIAELRTQASIEAQAAAATKTVIQLIAHLNTNLAKLINKMPGFAQMWSHEIEKINQVIYALQSGVNPGDYIDLQSMPSALISWKTLAGYIPKLTKTPEEGKTVTLGVNQKVSQ